MVLRRRCTRHQPDSTGRDSKTAGGWPRSPSSPHPGAQAARGPGPGPLPSPALLAWVPAFWEGPWVLALGTFRQQGGLSHLCP